MAHYLLNNINDPFAKLEAGQDFVDFSQFDGSKAFDTMGFADSEGAVNGRAGTQEVDGDKLDKLELQREKREKRDKTNELIELGFSMREARITDVTYSNGQFHMFGKAIDEEDMDAQVDETLKNIDDIADKHNLSGQEKTDLTTLLVAYQQADTPQEKAEVLTKIAEKQPEIGRELADDASKKREIRNQNDLDADESKDKDISEMNNDQFFVASRAETLEDVSLVEENVAMRDDISIGGNHFADTRGISEGFNKSASGVIITDNAPQALPEAQPNVPVLSNG